MTTQYSAAQAKRTQFQDHYGHEESKSTHSGPNTRMDQIGSNSERTTTGMVQEDQKTMLPADTHTRNTIALTKALPRKNPVYTQSRTEESNPLTHPPIDKERIAEIFFAATESNTTRNQLIQTLKTYFLELLDPIKNALDSHDRSIANDGVKGLYRLIARYNFELMTISKQFSLQQTIDISDMDRDKKILHYAMRKVLPSPIRDTRTHISRISKSHGVRTLTVASTEPRDQTKRLKPQTFYLVNHSADGKHSLGKGSFGATRTVLPASPSGRPVDYTSENEWAIKKVRPRDLLHFCSTMKEIHYMLSLDHIPQTIRCEAFFQYPSYKDSYDKSSLPAEQKRLPLQIGIIMRKGSPFKRLPDPKKALLDGEIRQSMLDWRERLYHYRDLCAGILAMQTKDGVHNDLKHGNIVVLPTGELKIIDFGLSFCLTSSLVDDFLARRTLGGTVKPPELVKDRTGHCLWDDGVLENPKAIDVWAIGQMLLSDFWCQFENQMDMISTKRTSHVQIDFKAKLTEHVRLLEQRLLNNKGDREPNLYEIAVSALKADPNERLTMSELHYALDTYIKEIERQMEEKSESRRKSNR